MKREVHDALQRARDLIADPARWTRNAPARDANGARIGIRSPHATCWCAIGALGKTSPDIDVSDAVTSLREATRNPITFVNDTQGHAAVLAMYDRALAEPVTE
jgi:hypothetical protein